MLETSHVIHIVVFPTQDIKTVNKSNSKSALTSVIALHLQHLENGLNVNLKQSLSVVGFLVSKSCNLVGLLSLIQENHKK